jgi:hypothetical protein
MSAVSRRVSPPQEYICSLPVRPMASRAGKIPAPAGGHARSASRQGQCNAALLDRGLGKPTQELQLSGGELAVSREGILDLVAEMEKEGVARPSSGGGRLPTMTERKALLSRLLAGGIYSLISSASFMGTADRLRGIALTLAPSLRHLDSSVS